VVGFVCSILLLFLTSCLVKFGFFLSSLCVELRYRLIVPVVRWLALLFGEWGKVCALSFDVKGLILTRCHSVSGTDDALSMQFCSFKLICFFFKLS